MKDHKRKNGGLLSPLLVVLALAGIAACQFPFGADSHPGAATYKIHFDANGGTGTMPDQAMVAGSTKKLTAGTFTRSGTTFVGWNTEATRTGTNYADEANYTMGSGGVTLHAVWAGVAWAQTQSSGGGATLWGVAIDSVGNAYAGGVINGTGTYSLDNGKSVTGTASGANVVLVKYSPSGATQWAQTLTSGIGDSTFFGVAVGPSGAIYAGGSASGTGTYDLGNSQTATGTATGDNVLLVKYNASGTSQWANTLVSGTSASRFTGVATDSSGNVYAVGYITGTSTFGFGNSQTATGTSSTGNVLLVKYDASGTAQWARTLVAGTGDSRFTGVATDASGNVFAVGRMAGTGTYDFGNSKTAAGAYAGGNNSIVVKYSAAGDALWASTVAAGPSDSEFTGVSIDSSGNVLACGGLAGTGTFDFGNSKTAAGTNSVGNTLLVKYDTSGTAQWAQTVTSGSGNYMGFTGVSADASGNNYAVGYEFGGPYGFGNGVTSTGPAGYSSVLVVAYDSAGVTQFAQTFTSGFDAYYRAVSARAGRVLVAGSAFSADYDFGNDVVVHAGSTSTSLLAAEYHW